ncbi:MAG: hypothetical protein QM750_22025 [Rubrivivax sp.]
MKLATGTVVDGKVVIQGEPLPEGLRVTVLARDEQTFEVPPDLEDDLLASMAEAQRGETLPADEVLSRLRRQTP